MSSKHVKTFIGTVTSDKADKTIVVSIVTRKTHPLYRKQYTSTKKFMAHDETNDAHEGDKVAISETRPLSARKRFVLTKVIERAPVRHVESNEVAESFQTKKAKEEAESKTDEAKPAEEAS